MGFLQLYIGKLTSRGPGLSRVMRDGPRESLRKVIFVTAHVSPVGYLGSGSSKTGLSNSPVGNGHE